MSTVLEKRELRDAMVYIIEGGTKRGLQPDLIVALQLATISGRIMPLPEENATTGRDWGRGYSAAIKDVLELLR